MDPLILGFKLHRGCYCRSSSRDASQLAAIASVTIASRSAAAICPAQSTLFSDSGVRHRQRFSCTKANVVSVIASVALVMISR